MNVEMLTRSETQTGNLMEMRWEREYTFWYPKIKATHFLGMVYW